VVYGHKDGVALVYDVIHPDEPSGAGVVYMVSGGWFSVWQPPERRLAQFQGLLDAGFTVFAVHHASAPRYKVPEAVSDVRAAVRHIQANAESYGVDAGRLGVWGGSAGGHLSLMLGLNPEAPPLSAPAEGRGSMLGPHYLYAEDPAPLAAVVAYYPPVDLRPLAGPNERFPALDFPAEQAAGISPILFVSDDDPPVLLIHGDADELVPIRNSEALTAEFEKVGVAHDFIVIEGGDHGFRNPADRSAAYQAMVAWFKAHLLPN
jgi:acetyl esterase/lipase